MTAPTQHQPGLRTGVSVAAGGGRLQARVELHGDLGPATAPILRIELDRLVADGIVDITIETRHLRLCTSDGLDLFDEIHRRLQRRHGGTLQLRLHGASDSVRRTIQLVDDNDPTFSPAVTGAPPASAMAPPERPGDRTS